MTDDENDQEVVFNLAEWSDEFRAAVTKVLDERGVPHDWEGSDLVVDDGDADAVDAILDEVEATPLEDIIELADVPPPARNEATYDALSALFVAADRLVHAPDDPDAEAELRDAAAGVAGTAPPYGVGDRDWARILAATDAGLAAADAATDDDAAAAVRALRDLLHPYV